MSATQKPIIKSTAEFQEFAKRFYPWFVRDEANNDVIKLLIEYVNEDAAFENHKGKNYSLGKGICLVGNPGTGKTILMEVLQKHFIAANDPMKFKSIGVPELAERFTDKDTGGFSILNSYTNSNCFFDELGVISRERVGFMGNKIVMGDVLIHHLEKKFTQSGKIFHFTTNCPIEPPKNGVKFEYDSLREIYEGRTVDRIYAMCNIIFLYGDSRRKTSKPVRRTFQEEKKKIPSADEVQSETLQMIIDDFNIWIKSKNTTAIKAPSLYFDLLDKIGILEINTEDMTNILIKAKEERLNDIKAGKSDISSFSIGRLIQQYKDGADMEAEERIKILAIGKRICIENYFKDLEITGTDKLTTLIKPEINIDA